MKFNPFEKGGGRWLTLLAAAAFSATSITILYSFLRFQSTAQTLSPTPPRSTIVVNAVAGLGHLEPQGEVINLSAPAFAEGTRVAQLLVKMGERVETGQVVAILDNRSRLEAALNKAQVSVRVSQTRLEQVKAGAKQGEINAQKAKIEGLKAELSGQIVTQGATIQRLEDELQGQMKTQQATIQRLQSQLLNAKTECARYQELYQEGAVTTSTRDTKCLEDETFTASVNEAQANLIRTINTLEKQIQEAKAILNRTVETTQKQLIEGKATLDQITEVRPVDIAVAQANLADAKAGVNQAQAELDLAYVRSPFSGQILKIHTWPGEIVSNKGIVELGRTDQMYAIAEIYESDISKVQLGQQATINSAGFPGELQGTVKEIGLEIGKKDVLGTDPTADVDSRVVEVKISLSPADSQRVAGLTNLQVKVIIHTSPPG